MNMLKCKLKSRMYKWRHWCQNVFQQETHTYTSHVVTPCSWSFPQRKQPAVETCNTGTSVLLFFTPDINHYSHVTEETWRRFYEFNSKSTTSRFTLLIQLVVTMIIFYGCSFIFILMNSSSACPKRNTCTTRTDPPTYSQSLNHKPHIC